MRLRIISGYLGGRFITVPQSDKIRPTTDRVRETVFNLLNNRLDFDGIQVLDLYSGSGSLGIETISRGASSVDFVERDNFIYKNLLKNIETLELNGVSDIFKMEAVKFTSAKREGYDLILADPPFFKNDIYKVVENIFSNEYLKPGSLLMIERSIQTKDEDTKNFNSEPSKIIGDACIYFLK